MPWDAKTFKKHNHALKGAVAGKAAKIANHVLESTGDEGEAIATANKYAGKLRKRGVISPKVHERMQRHG